MDFTKCTLYNLKSKNILIKILGLSSKEEVRRIYVTNNMSPFINIENGKERLIEAPSKKLKYNQRKLLKSLSKIEVPENIFSGVKKRSYIDNCKLHSGKNHTVKMDISKFYPHITRDKIYTFYKNELKTSSDVAEILTNFSTVDLNDFADKKNIDKVYDFIDKKNITCLNHLITGAPFSTLLSYLVNYKMFNKIDNLCEKHNIIMSVYVDDITLSSSNKIPKYILNKIYNILNNSGYKIAKSKNVIYDKYAVKKITGVIVNKYGDLAVPNKLIWKTHKNIKLLKQKKLNKPQILQGCVYASNQINNKFSNLKGIVKKL